MASSYVQFGSTQRFFKGTQIHREKKLWGEEQWIVNKEYCGKKLILKKNHRCSMHSHKKKDEVFYLQSGKVLLEMDGKSYVMKPGDFVHVQTGLPHRFTGLADSEIMEFSTTHDEADSYRSELSGHVEQARYDRESTLISAFKNVSILVVGDVMLDSYVVGSVERVSPEAPIPVVRQKGLWSVPGGAANAALNAAQLGSKPTLIGIIGKDAQGILLQKELKKLRVSAKLFVDKSDRITTHKQRVIAGAGQQIVRVDSEDRTPLDTRAEKRILADVKKLLPKHDVLLLSDYAKGVLTPTVLATCVRMAAKYKIPVVLDPKPQDSEYLQGIKGLTVITPNRKEAQLLLGRTKKPAELTKHATYALLTEGAEGMFLYRKGKASLHLSAHTHEVADVSGAGDTVATVVALALGAKGDIEDAVDLANRAAGIVVTKQGTATVTPEELLREL